MEVVFASTQVGGDIRVFESKPGLLAVICSSTQVTGDVQVFENKELGAHHWPTLIHMYLYVFVMFCFYHVYCACSHIQVYISLCNKVRVHASIYCHGRGILNDTYRQGKIKVSHSALRCVFRSLNVTMIHRIILRICLE